MTLDKIPMEDKYGVIVGEITSIRADGAYLVVTGTYVDSEHGDEEFTARIPIVIESG